MKRNIFCILMIVILLLSGCGNNSAVPSMEPLPSEVPASDSMESNAFSLSVVEDPDDESFQFEANGFSIDYIGLSDVTYSTPTKSVPLQDALQDGTVSVNMLIANARDDAEKNICKETATTRNGLTRYSYTYPEYRLDVIYDIYQTPDGKEHPVRDINISATSHHVDSIITIIDDETGHAIDREDWGLSFEVVDATVNTITVKCNQSGGMQIGDLQIRMYHIQNAQDGAFLEYLPEIDMVTEDTIAAIAHNSETNITIDWSDIYGDLASGEYIIHLYISDIYDPSQVHPLMKNYYDSQRYAIDFTIE